MEVEMEMKATYDANAIAELIRKDLRLKGFQLKPGTVIYFQMKEEPRIDRDTPARLVFVSAKAELVKTPTRGSGNDLNSLASQIESVEREGQGSR